MVRVVAAVVRVAAVMKPTVLLPQSTAQAGQPRASVPAESAGTV